MKLLTPQILTAQKLVNFHGIELIVSEDVKTLAADKDGYVYEYHTDAENVLVGVVYFYTTSDVFVEFVCMVDLEGMDWRETKVSV